MADPVGVRAGGRETGFAEANGARLYYEVAGEGPPLVLVHAGIADSRMWDEQFDAFAGRHRVIRYDLRGFGRSTMVPGPFAHRRDLHALLGFLGVERAALLGCSKGGATAIDFALEHPELVAALVPVACTPSGYQFGGEPPRQWGEMVAAFEARDFARASELEVQIWVDGPRRAPEGVAPAIRDRVREMNLIALATEAAELGEERRLEPPAIDRLGEIRAPTLVIVGDLDNPPVVAGADLLASGIAGARKVVIGGTAHFPNMERPEEFNRLVLDFLASLGQ